MDLVDITVKWPFKWCLVGSSGSGKTNFCLQIIKNALRILDEPPSKILIIYKEFQPIYLEFNNHIPTKIYNEDEIDLEKETENNKENLLMICDDLYFSAKINEVADHFLIKARHRNTSWIVLTQSIFNHSALKNISRNSTHITLFKSVRLNEPHIFFSQLRPKSSKVLQDIYKQATETSYSYLDIDLSQTCPDRLRYKTDIFREVVTVFVIMSNTSFKTMYLISQSDAKKYNDKNFQLSLQNKDICDGGVNVSIKPITKRRYNRKAKTETDDQMKNPHLEERGNFSQDTKNHIDIDKKVFYPSVRENKPLQMYQDTHKENEPLQIYPRVLRKNGYDLEQEYNNSDVVDLLQDTGMKDQKYESSDDTTFENISNDDKEIAQNQSNSINRKHDYETHDSKNDTSPEKISNTRATRLLKRKKYRKQHKIKRFAPYITNNKKRTTLDQNVDKTAKIDDYVKAADEPRVYQDNHNIQDISSPEEVSRFKKIKLISEPKIQAEDQWSKNVKTNLNNRRVQFKRKNDTVAYRVNPSDIQRSLLKPSDFTNLNKELSSDYLDKWKSLGELKQQSFKTKRFKPYRSFAVWK